MSDPIILTTRPNFTDEDLDNPLVWSMHTAYPSMKIAQEGGDTIPVSGQIEIEHNLGYNPYALVWGYDALTGGYVLASGDVASGVLAVYSDPSDLNSIYVFGTIGADFYYIIFYDEALD